MKEIRKSGFSKGYNIKKVITVDSRLNKKYDASTDSHDTNQYPNGMAGFVLLLLAYILFIIITLSVGFTNFNSIYAHQWQNTVLGGGMGYFLLNLLWVIGRTGLFNITGFAMHKFGQLMHFDRLREKVAKFTTTAAIKDVNNAADYKSYCEVRKLYTKKWCYISLITSGAVAVISLIVYFIALYA